MVSAARKSARRWCDGNRFTLLCDGEQFFPEMLEAIAGAREHIALEMYLAESGPVATRFVDALCAARARDVTVFVLLDDFGTFYLNRHDRQRLNEAGVTLARFNPLSPLKLAFNLVRDHRKLLLIDDRIAYVGGAGLTQDFARELDGAAIERSWRDNMIRAEGRCVGQWWGVFRANWRRWSDVACPLPPLRSVGHASGRVVAGRRGATVLTRAAIADIRRARERVWLATPYFVPARGLRLALARAARRGVDVRLLLPGPKTDHAGARAAGRRIYGGLLRRGVRVFEYQPAFLHAKMLLADERAQIGSCNFDRWSERWNLEANQAVEDTAFADEVAGVFEYDFAECREVTWQEWRQRPLGARLHERFWGTLETWAMRLSRRSHLVLGRMDRRRT
ncbi:MAG: phospholipase D-like domain-containing protein [Halofilum sp. (in: g-proteobacteria)]